MNTIYEFWEFEEHLRELKRWWTDKQGINIFQFYRRELKFILK